MKEPFKKTNQLKTQNKNKFESFHVIVDLIFFTGLIGNVS